MSSINGTVVAGVRWLIDAAGEIVGYRNPLTDTDTNAAFGGGGAWGGITGTLSDQEDLAEALGDKSDLLPAVTISEDSSLTVAAHANRLMVLSGEDLELTVQADANSGATRDEILMAAAMDGTSGSFVAADGVTINVPPGMTLNTGLSADGTICLQRIPFGATGAAQANVYRALSPKKRDFGLSATPTVLQAGSGSNQLSGSITIPGGALPINGAIVVRWVLARTGSTDTLVTWTSIGDVSAEISGGTSITTINFAAANVRLACEQWIFGNGTDQSSVIVNKRSGGESSGTVATGNDLTVTRDTSADWQIKFGGNAGTNDDWQVLCAVATIIEPSA